MRAALEKELAALSLEEKAEVIDFLIPAVAREHDEGIPENLMAELERRIKAHDEDPSGAISLEDWRAENGLKAR